MCSSESDDGKLVTGKDGSHSTLTFDAWIGTRYVSVEHIAPQSRSKGWASDLYQDEEYERLGNLTLLPLNANQSMSDRLWEHKRKLFGALAATTQTEALVILDQLKAAGVDLSKVAGSIHSGHFLPHVRALSKFAEDWTVATVDSRGRELADLAWRRLAPWLGMNPDA